MYTRIYGSLAPPMSLDSVDSSVPVTAERLTGCACTVGVHASMISSYFWNGMHVLISNFDIEYMYIYI